MNRTTTIRLALGAAVLAMLAGCGDQQTRRTVANGAEEAVMIQKGTYVYNPNRRPPPVSLSRSDLEGIIIQ